MHVDGLLVLWQLPLKEQERPDTDYVHADLEHLHKIWQACLCSSMLIQQNGENKRTSESDSRGQ